MSSLFEIDDEIISIEYIGEQETIDINTSGNRLFYANGILTHNSAVEEIEFDHSHISGGISKINTADNVFGIFTSRAMRERGKYQIQCMKSRSSTGVGQKIDLEYNIDTMRITDAGGDQPGEFKSPAASIMNTIKAKSSVIANNNNDTVSHQRERPQAKEGMDPFAAATANVAKVTAQVETNKVKNLLANLKRTSQLN